MTAPPAEMQPSIVHVPSRRRGPAELVVEGLAEVLSRQRLIRYMIGANLKRTHTDTALGQLWWVLDPLFLMGIYVVLVQIIFNVGTPDYPLFIFAAILPWKWFSIALGTAAGSVTAREGLIRQVQFPKLVLPVAAVGSATINFAISLIALALMYVLFLDRISPWLLAIPLIAVVQFVFSLAVAIALAAVNTFYRDVQNLLGHVVRLWFYASPGLWSFRDHLQDSPELRTILQLNPMAPILESYRNVIYGATDGSGGLPPDFIGLGWVLLASIMFVTIAIVLFKRMEPAFAKVV